MSKILLDHIDYGFGFPVIIDKVVITEFQGEEILDIDYNELEEKVLRALCYKETRLTKEEIKFIRLYLNMTEEFFNWLFNDELHMNDCIKDCKHLKQEVDINWFIEKLIRIYVITLIGESLSDPFFLGIFLNDKKEYDDSIKPLHIETLKAFDVNDISVNVVYKSFCTINRIQLDREYEYDPSYKFGRKYVYSISDDDKYKIDFFISKYLVYKETRLTKKEIQFIKSYLKLDDGEFYNKFHYCDTVNMKYTGYMQLKELNIHTMNYNIEKEIRLYIASTILNLNSEGFLELYKSLEREKQCQTKETNIVIELDKFKN